MEEKKQNKVGFVYDERMLLHKLSGKQHPECPERIERIISNLKDVGLWEHLDVVEKVEPVTKEILELVYR